MRRVRCVPLLPEEFGGPEKQPRPHLPTYDVRPLVDEKRKIAPGVYPLREAVVDNRLGRGADDKLLLELLPPRMRHDRELGREPFDVLRLPAKESLGDQEREIRVLVPRFLQHPVQRLLYELPDRVAPGTDHHAPLDGGIIGHLGRGDHVRVPARKILAAGGDFDFYFLWVVCAHPRTSV